jgi:hypothetical protein
MEVSHEQSLASARHAVEAKELGQVRPIHREARRAERGGAEHRHDDAGMALRHRQHDGAGRVEPSERVEHVDGALKAGGLLSDGHTETRLSVT